MRAFANAEFSVGLRAALAKTNPTVDGRALRFDALPIFAQPALYEEIGVVIETVRRRQPAAP